MKTCPNCNEMVGDNVEICFNCNYNFIKGKILTKEEIEKRKNEKREEQKLVQEETQKRIREEENRIEEENKFKEELERLKKLPFVLSTTDRIEENNILAYKGIVNGDVVIGTGFLSEFAASRDDFWGQRNSNFEIKLSRAKEAAYLIMKEKGEKLGANTIVGVDFSIAVTNSNMMMVSCIGTAVVRRTKVK